MALNSNALTSVATVKSYLEISVSTYDTLYDTLIELLINGVSEWIENEIARVIKDSGANIVELHDGSCDGSVKDKIFAKQWPVNSITSIEYRTGSIGNPTWVAFTTDDYTFDSVAGIIYLGLLSTGKQNIRLTYKGGFTTVPSDLELACIKMTAKEFDRRKSQGVTQESVGGGSVVWNEALDGYYKAEQYKIIQKYRRFA